MDVVCRHILISGKEFLHPVRMLAKNLIAADIRAFQYCFFQSGHFTVQTGRKHRKTHNLNQADVFLFDMVQLCMRMVNAHGMFFCGNVVAQHQIQFVVVTTFSCDGGNGIVRLPICFSIDKCLFVCVVAPFIKNHVGKGNKPVAVRTGNTDNGHGPVHNSRCYIFKAFYREGFVHAGFGHGEFIVTALEVVMA